MGLSLKPPGLQSGKGVNADVFLDPWVLVTAGSFLPVQTSVQDDSRPLVYIGGERSASERLSFLFGDTQPPGPCWLRLLRY